MRAAFVTRSRSARFISSCQAQARLLERPLTRHGAHDVARKVKPPRARQPTAAASLWLVVPYTNRGPRNSARDRFRWI
jgi:hypothetical protein